MEKDNIMDVIKLGDGEQIETYTGNDSVYVRGQKGADTITGGAGNDVIEGNQGNDELNGGAGDDILFGGVGNDELTGGEGEDTFAMRITHGGVNTIKDFEVGTDSLQFLVDRKHFVLSNDLARNDKHEGRVDEKLDGKLEGLNTKFFGGELNLQQAEGESEETFGFENANTFVEKALGEKLTISLDSNGTLVLTFFEGNKGTTINLEGLGDNALIKSIMGDKTALDPTDKADALMIDNIVGVLTGDIPVFEGSAADYSFQTYGYIRVVDSVDGRDGESKVYIENGQKIQFGDDIYTWQRGHNAGDNMTAISNDGTLMVGMHGVDKLIGGDGADVLIGDNGTHFHYKGSGDELSGGDGNDILIGGAGNDILDGGLGEDTAVFSGSILEYRVDKNFIRDLISDRDGTDQLIDSSVEKVSFSEGTYTLITGHNAQDGHPGNVNKMTAEDQVDTLLVGDGGHDILTGGSGSDVLFGDTGVNGGSGNDTLNGGAGNDLLVGGGGNDILDGGIGEDTAVFSGSILEYRVDKNYIKDSISNRDGTDQLIDSSVEKVSFSEGTYTLITGHNAQDGHPGNVNKMTAEDQVDTLLVGDGGHDILTGGSGSDVLFGDTGVNGGTGNDILNGGAGNDLLVGGGGNDIIDGGEGEDTVIYNDASITKITKADDVYTIETNEGTDTVVGVELIKIGDDDSISLVSYYDEFITS
ncbi:hypothetical protein L4C42_02205 [Vibrio wakamikoensis]|uniref:Calcium-binding protein n=1 Tax=Vibrio chaetopteri TaxID=3016528 RepID=A0AAU8BM30_9VIBR